MTRLIRSEGEKQLNTLTILTPDGPEKLTATREHPFWSPSELAWVEAGDLALAMTLRTETGETVEITGNKSFTKRTKTYNFTVDELHTYYVLAGDTPVLVHNSCVPSISRQKQDQHVLGTKEYQKRLDNGTPTSVFGIRSEADAYARDAWQNGTPVPGRSNVRDYEYGRPVGRGPNGGWQTRVRVHIDQSGKTHAHPVGREYFG